MNLYQIVDVDGNAVTGAMSYAEAQRYMQKNRMSHNEYSIELHMPVKRAAAVTEDTAKFSELYEMELEIQRSKATEGFGIDPATRERAKADTKRLSARLYAAIDALSATEAKAYGNYRLSQR